MANGIAIKDVDNKLQSLGGEEVIPISTGVNLPEVVEVDTLKEYINADIDTALEGKQDVINDLDTIRSGAALGATALQSYTESDPTVHDWAKAEQKPSYTASEVGAVPTTRKINNKALSSDINLTASDVGALPDNTIIPDAQIQSDWNQSDNTKKDYIKNKPTNVSAFNNDAGYLTSHQDISGKQDVLTAGSNINISNENVISATDTTYESKTASSGGTDVSLVTTGEKYTWNSKADPSIVPYIYVGTGTNWGPDSFDCYLRPAYFQGGVVPTKAGDYVYSTGTGCLHKCGTITPVSGQTYNMTTPVYVGKINSYPGSAASGITSSNISTWNDKQDALVSGTNIKTINNESLLGSGNISVSSGGTQVQADWSQSDNTQTDYIKNKPTLGTAATLDVASSGDAGTTEVVKGDDSRLTDARTPTTHSHTVSQITDFPTIPTVPTNVSAFTNDAGYTTNTGTITSVKMNGSTIASSGEADLGTVLTSHQDISGKADKATSATNGNFAALDSNGNLTDSGHKHSDYLTSHQDLSNYVQKSSTAGLLKNDGTVDTSTYLTQHQDLSNYIQKSSTSGLVKNDGTIDTSTYLTQHQDISNYIQKSNTAGLVKNDGTIDTSTYLTTAPVTSVNGNTGDVTISTGDANVIEGIKLDGESSSLTPSSKVVTIPSMGASGSNHRGGLVPDPGSTNGTTKYLREDGSWQTPPDTNTTYSASDFDIKDLTDSTSLMSTWSGKQDALSSQTVYTSQGSATKVPQITTNSLGQVTSITEVTITQPDVSNFISTSSTTGLVKNDGSIDTNTYLTSSDLSGYVQTSSTTGLIKNDGTVDTTAYGTYSKPSGGIPASDIASGVIPTVPSNIVTGTSSSYTIWVGTQIQYEAISTKDATTIYLITES